MRPTLSHTVHQHLIVALKSYRHMLRKRQFATPSHRTTLLSVNVFVLASVECIYSLRATPPDQNYRSKGLGAASRRIPCVDFKGRMYQYTMTQKERKPGFYQICPCSRAPRKLANLETKVCIRPSQESFQSSNCGERRKLHAFQWTP